MLRRLRTTHDWSADVEAEHMATIRGTPERYGAHDACHLVLEVLAYALDEACEGTTERVSIRPHPDGSVSLVDDGRGTDTRPDEQGSTVVKPVMATHDLRFFGRDDAPRLADGLQRSEMSVVTAMSTWLVHENRRASGAWQRRYAGGFSERRRPWSRPTAPPARPCTSVRTAIW